MCGFVGYIKDKREPVEAREKIQIERMTEIIEHRGPDDIGYYMDEYIRFGFRRLSIIDIDGGCQPLSFENDRYWIVFNGEIYNYKELRRELKEQGCTFQTHSDTEVIAALFHMKKESAFVELRGMFSLLIWDKRAGTLYGARDAFGIKPFYYWEAEDGLYCASEKKSLFPAKENNRVQGKGSHYYLNFQYVPEPYTMSAGIQKLEPGCYFRKKPEAPLEIETYWKPSFQPVPSSEKQEKDAVRTALREAVHLHMQSDVPVGAFLSGGVDSSAIAALAKEVHPGIKTFTVGFEREGYSEMEEAQATAEQLGVEHVSCLITPEEVIRELPALIWHMDDPVADPAAIPLYFVAREARKHVKVVLSGEGADELFGGYRIYQEPQALQAVSGLPGWAQSILKYAASRLPQGMKGKSFMERGTTPLEKRFIGNASLYSEAEKARLLTDTKEIHSFEEITAPIYRQAASYSEVQKMQYMDLLTWLRGDILVKADRMTMAHSLELRVPFLDQQVFQAASRLNAARNVTRSTTKRVLREAMRGIVPDSVLYNPKLGFPVPIRHWLRHELYDWALRTIKESPVNHLFHKKEILRQLDEHARGKQDYSRRLWAVLVFIMWHHSFIYNRKQPLDIAK
ncbi:asparagine synthase (glutamine-hydrolyzing) [Salibacterium aidingense]|uniref:asparagine synthase (glutamine-hydrolyzing) n=1 Tax=Salibacterium aidingense TaxID=384933 RepID=UPI00041B92A3|nr:asparagine synthase (glutamine-hydrolyzing) [Salibacterium aidingense]